MLYLVYVPDREDLHLWNALIPSSIPRFRNARQPFLLSSTTMLDSAILEDAREWGWRIEECETCDGFGEQWEREGIINWEGPTDRQAVLLTFWQREHGRRFRLAQEESDLAEGRIGRLGRIAIWGRRIGDRLLNAAENGHSVDGRRIILNVRYSPEDGRRRLSFRLFWKRRQESYTDENGVVWRLQEYYTDKNGEQYEVCYPPEGWEPPEEWFEEDDSLEEIVMVLCTKGEDTEPNGNGDEHGGDAWNSFLAELQSATAG